ncbi:hypothetical protein [Streptomyces sp. NPDC091209]|uniref:hypothetical protein n=1 Tax=Streptomyces sp. NPDC091209 TaxID=3365974 RepID=UPI00380E8B88
MTAGVLVAPSGKADVASVADGTPGHAVEGFDHSQAGKLLAGKGLALRHGDGRTTLDGCVTGPGGSSSWPATTSVTRAG